MVKSSFYFRLPTIKVIILTLRGYGSGSGPQGQETSSYNSQSTPARSDALRESDVEDICSGRSDIETEGQVSKASTNHDMEFIQKHIGAF